MRTAARSVFTSHDHARRLAKHLGLAYLESGKLYRAVALDLLRRGLDPSDSREAAKAARALVVADLDDPDLFDEATARAASIVAAIAEVREALLAFQRDFAAHPPNDAKGAVIDGRDIGTAGARLEEYTWPRSAGYEGA